MIIKWYEISCNSCSCGQHYQGNKQIAEEQYRKEGGIVTKKGRHFCCKKCYKKDLTFDVDYGIMRTL